MIIIATDGEPTNEFGIVNTDEFTNMLLKRPDHVFTSIVACTNDPKSIDYLHYLDLRDEELPRFDVVREYMTETAFIKNIQGSDFQFTYGDWHLFFASQKDYYGRQINLHFWQGWLKISRPVKLYISMCLLQSLWAKYSGVVCI